MKKLSRTITNGFLMYLILLWSLISLITFPIIGTSASSTEDWPMFRCNPEHTGFSISSAPTDNETTALLWSNTTDGAIRFSSPAVFGDWLFIGSEDGYVYAFNSTSGCQKWKSKFLGGQIQSSPAVSNGRVFVGSLDGKIHALNMTDGEASLWNKTIGNQVWSSPTVACGKVYIASFNCTVYALNETSGNVIWRNYTAQPSKSSPAVADGKLFIGSLDCRVYAFNAENGTLEWNSTHLGGYIKESSPAVLNETVFIGAANNTLYALHKSNGTVHWKGETQGSIRSSPAVGYGKVYVGSEDDRVYAFNASTGAQVWDFTTGGDVCSSPAVANGAVFVGSCDGEIYALNASTGEELWSHQTPREIWSSPAVANGRVFVGSKDKKVYAFGKNTPPKALFGFDPIEPEANENVTFNASNSSDPDPLDYIINYMWDFGDGSDIANTTEPIITHEYHEGGDYNVTLIVTDCYGAESSETRPLKVRKHEVTIVDVSPENINVTKGGILDINVTVKNEGDYNETVTVTVWCSNDTYKIPVNDAQNVSLLIDENRTLVFSWNTTYFTRGTYHISATVADKEKDDGNVTILVHDLALSNIVANTTEVVINQTVSIDITVYNEGDFTESNVTVTVYANSTSVGNCTGNVLKASSWFPKIEWNTTGFTLGNYNILGSVTIVPNDVNFTNNNFTNGIVRVRPPFHDVSVVEILLSIPGPPYNITRGDSMNITVSVRNQGEYPSENVTVTTWYSNATTPRPVNITCVTLENLEKNETRPVPLPWNTTGFSGGYYTIGAYVNITGKDEYPDNNNETLDDKVLIIAPWHDIRVREVKPLKPTAFLGFDMPIHIVFENIGNFTMDPFSAYVYCNGTQFGSHPVPPLDPGEQEIWELDWTPTSIGNNSIEVYADISDNNPPNNYKNTTIEVEMPVSDIAINWIDTTPHVYRVGRGRPVTITVGVENQGAYDETFTLNVYANQTSTGNITLIETQNVHLNYLDLPIDVPVTWNTTIFMLGVYEIFANVTILPGEKDKLDNYGRVDHTVEIELGIHDVAVIDEPRPFNKTVLFLSFRRTPPYDDLKFVANVSVTIRNKGTSVEDVNVTIYLVDTSGNQTPPVGNLTVFGLLLDDIRTVIVPICVWNDSGIEKGIYQIRARVDIPEDDDPSNNERTNPFTYERLHVSMIGDITGPESYPDGKCDIRDVAMVAILYGVIYPNLGYDPNCDVTGPILGVADGKIDIRDVALIAIHYGEVDP